MKFTSRKFPAGLGTHRINGVGTFLIIADIAYYSSGSGECLAIVFNGGILGKASVYLNEQSEALERDEFFLKDYRENWWVPNVVGKSDHFVPVKGKVGVSGAELVHVWKVRPEGDTTPVWFCTSCETWVHELKMHQEDEELVCDACAKALAREKVREEQEANAPVNPRGCVCCTYVEYSAGDGGWEQVLGIEDFNGSAEYEQREDGHVYRVPPNDEIPF